MPEYVIHPQTKVQLDMLYKNPPHAILLSGPSGSGKAVAANKLASLLLQLDSAKLADYPYVRYVKPVDRKAIGIEMVRELEHSMSLKIPGSRKVARVAIIEDAHLLTVEAQNALLKTLEEPPADTVLILTATHEQALLPTIRSRLQTVAVKKPPLAELMRYFSTIAPDDAVKRALVISGGLPGLTGALLQNDSEHPLVQAVQSARELLQSGAYSRLLKVDELAKQKELSRDVCYVLGQMAKVALTNGSSVERWQRVMAAAYAAEEALLGSGQPKLVLTNLMLQL